jgi:hypothetical protein
MDDSYSFLHIGMFASQRRAANIYVGATRVAASMHRMSKTRQINNDKKERQLADTNEGLTRASSRRADRCSSVNAPPHSVGTPTLQNPSHRKLAARGFR